MPITKRFACLLGGIALWIVAAAHPAHGQGSSGLFGSRSVGSSISAGSRNTFGSGGAGGVGGGMGGGQIGNQLDQLGSTGDITGSERFIRGNRTAASFVGSDTSENASFVGALGGGTAGGMGMAGALGGAGRNSALGGRAGMGGAGARNTQRGRTNLQQGANRNRQINLRTQLRVGFRYQPKDSATVQTKLVGRLNSASFARLGTLEVELSDQVATLRGRVATPSDRRIAVRLAKLEPGVETVRDELTVDSPVDPWESPSDRQSGR